MNKINFNLQLFATGESLSNGSNDLEMNGSAYDDTITNSGNYVTIWANGGNDYIAHYYYGGDYNVIYGGAGNDTIYNMHFRNLIDGESGNDYIFNQDHGVWGYNHSVEDTIYGGAGNDTIIDEYNLKNLIYGGAGNDFISILGGQAHGQETISGGTGNDTIYLNNQSIRDFGNVYLYENGDGNDIIYYLSSYDTINLGSTIYSSVKSGSNVILKVGSGKVTLVGASNKTLNIVVETKNIHNKTAKTTISGTDVNDTIKNSADKVLINAYAGNDKIYIASNYSNNTVKGGAGNDSIFGGGGKNILYGDEGKDTLNGGKGNNTLTGGKGNDIFIYESGNDVITDYKAGEDKIKLNVAMKNYSVSGNDVILKTSKGNVTLKNGKGKKITILDSKNKTTEKIYYANGLTASDSLLTATTVFSGNKIDLANYSAAKNVNASALSKINIIGNSSANSLKSGKGNDTLKGGGGNDTLYGGSGADKLYGGTGNDKIYGESGNDTLYGEDGKDTLYGGDGADKIIGGADNDYLSGDKGKDTLYGGTGNDILKGGADNDSIFGESGNDTLSGDAGNDTLNGGKGNDTLTGGAGKDVFIYESGYDLITDYAAEDKIKIASGTISDSYSSGKDIIFEIGSGTLTVKNGKGKNITFLDSTNKTLTYSKTTYLFEDNNFVTDALNLDSITESKVAVQNIETQNNFNLEKEQNILTFADK